MQNNDTKNYAVVTAAYWGFTLTDGALRMLVLLHFHGLGYSPLDLAFLFLLYEVMGIVTNFVGGWVGARFGLRVTLFSGLGLQVAALLMLSALPNSLVGAASVIYVMSAQGLSGIAKDLTKMSSKSAVKLVVNESGEGLLFKWVSRLTGSKNALKGLGFFIGGALLEAIGFAGSLYTMAAALLLVLGVCWTSLKSDLGKASSKIRGKDLFSKTREINYLSAARIFLFASRDVWFVVGLPVFLASEAGWSFDQIGGFMALWIIGYGTAQALVPNFLRKTKESEGAILAAKIWGTILMFSVIILATGLAVTKGDTAISFNRTIFLIVGLIAFGLIFAINSALHSYLIVAFSDHDKVALNVGFYYTANAIGRLVGTLLSGLIYQYFGLVYCLIASAIMVALAVILTLPLKRNSQTSAV